MLSQSWREMLNDADRTSDERLMQMAMEVPAGNAQMSSAEKQALGKEHKARGYALWGGTRAKAKAKAPAL